MSLESATYIHQLVATNPTGSDPIAQGDDHIRMIKSALKATFPSITGPVTVNQDTLNGVNTLSGRVTTLENTVAAAPDGIGVVGSLPSTGTDGDVIFNTATNKLYQRINGVWTEVVVQVNATQGVADGSITTAKFAQGIRPIEVVDSLPTSGNSQGRMVFLTTDSKIYRYNGTAFVTSVPFGDLTGSIAANQIAANTITGGMIQAGAISADQIASGAISTAKLAAGAITTEKITAGAVTSDIIAAGSITTDKIAANAITAGKISAGAIGTSQLQAGAVTASNISAGAITSSSISVGAVTSASLAPGSVTADKVAANSITVGKLSSSSAPETIIAGLSFGLGQTESNSGWTSAGYFRTTNGSYAGSLAITTAAGVPAEVGISGNSGGYGGGWYNYSGATKLTQMVGGYGTYAAVAQHISSNKTLTLANSSYAAYAAAGGGKIYAVDGMGPFTGVHDGVTTDTPALGDIMVDHQILAHESISSSIASFKIATQANQKGVIGVCSEVFDTPPAGWRPEDPIFGQEGSTVVNPSVPAGHKVIHVNALGEGLINVCGENGNIEKGDLIVTSSIPGKGMKQADDIIRGYTVAKAREAVSFSSPTEVKQIACVYLAG